MEDVSKEQFEVPNKYDELFYGFVHEEVTYCFFLITDEPLPTQLFAYENAIRSKKIFAASIQRHVIKYNSLERMGLMLDAECMGNADGSFKITKVCDHLYHIFMLL